MGETPETSSGQQHAGQQHGDEPEEREATGGGEWQSRAGRPPGEPTIDPAEDDPDREGEDRFDAG
jgi:hypothetical protein